MRSKQSTSKWIRRREVLVNTLAGWVPTFSLGLALRDLLYRTINRIGTSVYIEDGAELVLLVLKLEMRLIFTVMFA